MESRSACLVKVFLLRRTIEKGKKLTYTVHSPIECVSTDTPLSTSPILAGVSAASPTLSLM